MSAIIKKGSFLILLFLSFILVGCEFKINTPPDPVNPNYCEDGEHIEGDWAVTDATCTVDGKRVKTCTICGKVLQEEVIKSTGHVPVIDSGVEATCTSKGLTEGSHCSVCGEILIAQKEIDETHEYIVLSKVDPTDEAEGYIEYKCEKCGKTYKEILAVVGNYDPTSPTVITLVDNGSVVSNDNGGVTINGNTITITLGGEYTISGTLSEGNIILKLDDDAKATINLAGVNITSTLTHVIYIESGNKVEISAKNGTKNYLYDKRAYDSEGTGGAIYALCDLELKGKGSLKVEATYNNGVATKDDLEIKNLTLEVSAPNNALKGNDSITISSGNITAISTGGDALKTENSDVSSKGNQRGIIQIDSGTINLYAACDGIDASYDCIINGGTINIYTEKYSSYSGEVTVTSSSKLYLRVSSRLNLNNTYKYYAMFIDDNGETWKQGTYKAEGRQIYYVIDKPSSAKYVKFYIYNSSQTGGQTSNYVYCSDQLTLPTSNDCYYVSNVNNQRISGQWTNYSTSGGQPGGGPGGAPGGGPGGMDGNKDKADYSCKGIKADNVVTINGGIINVSSHDDAIHANGDVTLETGSLGKGEVVINGGTITLTTEDDGIHADSTLTINDGDIKITKSYEGIEGTIINIKGGNIVLTSSDDGLNARSQLNISGGFVYMNANGDGLDCNGVATMSGGIVLALGPQNGGNGVIDFDRSFTFSGGLLLAIGCSGMNQKPTAASGCTSNSQSISTTTSSFVNVVVNNDVVATIKVVKGSQNYCVLAYSNSDYPNAKVSVTTQNSNTLVDGLYYVK